MAVLSNTGILAGASAAGGDGYKVEKGLKLDSTQSKHLSWEPTTKSIAAGLGTALRNFTISFWTKVDGRVDGTKAWCSAGASSQINGILQLYIEYGKVTINCYNAYMQSARRLADPSAWYHIVLAVDTDQVEPIDRFKVWVNNERITDWGSPTYPYRGYDIIWNTNVPHQIGAMRNASSANSSFGDGYLAEFYNIDSQTLDPSYFGETNDNGKWVPKEYKGTYGLQVDNSVDWSGNNDPTDGPLSSSGGSWDSAANTAEQLFTYESSAAGNAYCGGVGQALTWEPVSAYTFTDKVEIRTTTFSGAAYAQVATLTYSDLTTASTTFTDWGWTTIATGGGTIKKIVMQAAAGDYNYWNAIRIDGKVLIDSVHSTITDNSFYLKFSGDGKLYSDDIVGTEYDQTYYHKGMMFDGNTATSYLAWNGNDVTWTPSGGLAFDSTLRIEAGDGDIVFNWDGGSYTLTTSGGKTWYDVSSNVQSPITSVTWTCSALGSGPYVYRVEVDGEVLIEADDIEADSSGNGNHVKANNLEATSGQIYSSGSTVGTVNNPWTYAFDGLEGDGAYTYSNSSATITLPSPKDWNSKFEVYIMYHGGTLTVNGSDVGSSNISSGGATPTWYDITNQVGASGTLTSIGVSDTPTGYYTSLRAVRLDGEVLIDGPGAADIVLDSPTDFDNEGKGVGNYCTWNPLTLTPSADTLAKGNLEATHATGVGWAGTITSTFTGTIGMTSGKWYFEVTPDINSANKPAVGITTIVNGEYYVGYPGNGIGHHDSAVYTSDWQMPQGTTAPTSFALGDVLGVAVDMDNGFVWFSINNDWQNSGDPTNTDAASNGAYGTGFVGETMYPAVSQVGSAHGFIALANFGAEPFAYTPPTDFKALNTYNLSAPTIKDPSKHFKTVTYDGTGGAGNVITGDEAGNDFKFSPDMVWLKARDEVRVPSIHDTVRGDNKILYTGGVDVEGTVNGVEFGTNSYTLGNDGYVNSAGKDWVAWNWNAGSASAPTTINAGVFDATSYDTSEDWSASFANGAGNTTDVGQAFRGITNATGTGLSTTFLSLTDKPFDVSSTISLWVHDPGTVPVEMEYNGTTYTNSSPTRFGWTDFTVPSGSNSGTLKARLTSSGDEIRGVKIDGKILVDSDLTPPNLPSVDSTYRANPDAGFSIVSFEGTGNAGTVAHGLNAKPSFIISKNRDTANDWPVWHSKFAGATHSSYINGQPSAAASPDATIWPADHDSNVIQFGSAAIINGLNNNTILYCWSEVEGYSKFGSYTGSGLDNGPFIYCGFRPAFVMIGPNGNYSDWYIYDNERWPHNPAEDPLGGNEDDTEANFDARLVTNHVDILSNGFKLRFADVQGYHNYNTWSYSFAAFAESPFKYANAR